MFIVEIVGLGGTRRFVLVDGVSNSSLARTKAEQSLQPGEFANLSVTADDDGIAQLRTKSSFFRELFNPNMTTATILTALGGGGVGGEATVGIGGDFGGVDFGTGGPTDPVIGSEGPGGFGAAFRNILAQQGLGGLRGVGRSLQDPLQTLFQTGLQGAPGVTGGLFAVDPGRGQFQRTDFISRALAGIRGGTSSIGDIASQIFGAGGTAEQEKFFIPEFGTRGEVEDAITGAELSRLAARQQFGTAFASALPSAFDLVEEFRAQPQGTGTFDFRDFLSRRTQRGFTR